MGGKKVPVGTTRKFGPYKGSEKNDGRKIYVEKTKTKDGWKATSQTKARSEYEAKNGKLPKDVHVDHKDNNKNNDSAKNLRAVKGSENVAKENMRRAGKK
jgi:hypothetical protein